MENNQRRSARISMRVSVETKEFLKNRAEKLGYKSVTAFMIAEAKKHTKIKVETSKYEKMTQEINQIGKDINILVRRIYSDKIYSDTDIEMLAAKQQMIIDLMQKEYNQILKFNKKYTLDEITLSEKEKLKKMFIEQNIPVPKKLLLEEFYDKIRSDFLYIIATISNSPIKNDRLDFYLHRYMDSGIITSFDEETLVKFADEIYKYTQRIKFKMTNFENDYDDDDWYALKDILDEYEEDF